MATDGNNKVTTTVASSLNSSANVPRSHSTATRSTTCMTNTFGRTLSTPDPILASSPCASSARPTSLPARSVSTPPSDGGMFELTGLPKDADGEVKDSSADGKKGPGASAIFVARNRFAVLNKTSQVRFFFVVWFSM